MVSRSQRVRSPAATLELGLTIQSRPSRVCLHRRRQLLASDVCRRCSNSVPVEWTLRTQIYVFGPMGPLANPPGGGGHRPQCGFRARLGPCEPQQSMRSGVFRLQAVATDPRLDCRTIDEIRGLVLCCCISFGGSIRALLSTARLAGLQVGHLSAKGRLRDLQPTYDRLVSRSIRNIHE